MKSEARNGFSEKATQLTWNLIGLVLEVLTISNSRRFGGDTFPKQSVIYKWHPNGNNIHGNRTPRNPETRFSGFWEVVEGQRFFVDWWIPKYLDEKSVKIHQRTFSRDSPRPLLPDAWSILAHVPDNTPSNAHGSSRRRVSVDFGVPWLLCSTTWSCWDPKGVRNKFFIKCNQNAKKW